MVKIADFGLSSVCNQENCPPDVSRIAKPIKWTALEDLVEDVCNEKTDVVCSQVDYITLNHQLSE